jgi:hypothetical protein
LSRAHRQEEKARPLDNTLILCSPPIQKPKTSAKTKKNAHLDATEGYRRKSAPIRRAPKDDTEIRVESALIELSELKSQVYFERQTVDGKLKEIEASPRLRASLRPFTSSVMENKEERDVHHRLIVAENLMRQLYRKNKLLSELLTKPDQERIEREAKLTENLREKTEENKRLQQQLADMQHKMSSQPSDSYVEFLEQRVKETLEDSKRHLANYSQTKKLLMTSLKTSGSDDSVVRQLKSAIEAETTSREKERGEYEARIEKVRAIQWRSLNCAYFVERKQLLKRLEALES